MASLKGPGEAQKHDGSALRIGIVHARWNSSQSLPPKDPALLLPRPDHLTDPEILAQQ
jgi:hypothetical protein